MSDKVGAVLVMGAGIGGMQSSLDLADAGFKVYLLDENPSIGGTMAQLDKTFPTNDCSMCIMSPKMVDVTRHPNIELLVYSELLAVDGEVGNFKITAKKKSRFVDETLCIGCGTCVTTNIENKGRPGSTILVVDNRLSMNQMGENFKVKNDELVMKDKTL